VSSIAVPFDAGSDDFDVLGCPPIFSPYKRHGKIPGLDACIHPAQKTFFARWIEREMKDASWFTVTKSKKFPGSLILDLPALPRRTIRAKQVSLEIGLPDPDNGVLPVVLWLQNIQSKGGRRRQMPEAGRHLPAVDEEQEDGEDDDTSVTEVEPEDSISCTGRRARCRHGGDA